MNKCYKVSWLEFDNEKEATKSVSVLSDSDANALKKVACFWHKGDEHAIAFINSLEGNLESIKIQLIVFQIIIEDVVLEKV